MFALYLLMHSILTETKWITLNDCQFGYQKKVSIVNGTYLCGDLNNTLDIIDINTRVIDPTSTHLNKSINNLNL